MGKTSHKFTFCHQIKGLCLMRLRFLLFFPLVLSPLLISLKIMSQDPPYTASILSVRTFIDLPPEILCWVGNNLTSADLAACVQVSREWHTLFCPFLYNVLDLRRPRECEQDPPVTILSDVFSPRTEDWERYRKITAAPSIAAFLQYHLHIKHLVVDDKLELSSRNNIHSRLTSLIDLRVEGDNSFCEGKDQDRFSLMIMFTKNPGLQVIDLHQVDLSRAAEFSRIAETCLNLTKLQLEDCFLDQLDFAKGLKTCRSLLSLSIRWALMNLDENRPLLDRTLAPRLKELKLATRWWDAAAQHIYDLVSRSELQSLELDLGGHPHRIAKIRLNQCKNLFKLTIKNVNEDMKFSEILDSCPNALEELSIEDCNFGERTMESAHRHFEALKTFRLKGIDKTTTFRREEWPEARGRLIAERKLTDVVIRSCPKLAYLECPRLESIALLPKESGCSSWNYELDAGQEVKPSSEQSVGLKTLKVGTLHRGNWVAKENDQRLEPLPAMKNLETLVLEQITVFDKSECCTKLDNRFGSGGEYDRSRMKQDEKLRWMLQWWPKLTSFVNGNGL